MDRLVKVSLVVFVVIFIVIIVFSVSNAITVDKAMVRFEEITGSKDIVIIRHSNMAFVFGNPFDVIFELKVDGKYVSARCTSNVFSEMVCRVYTGDETD